MLLPGRRWKGFSCWVAISAFLVAFSLIYVPAPGVNEPHYLTKARSFVDPDWCAADFFLQSADAHYVFFALVGPFTRLFSFSTVAVSGRMISLSLLACGWTMIGRRVGLSAVQRFMSACLFCGVSLTGNFSGEWIVGGFEGKVVAYGLAFIGIARWLDAWTTADRRRYLQAGLCFGGSVAFHPVVGLWFCIGVTLSELARQLSSTLANFRQPSQRRRLQQFVGDGLTFSVTAFCVALPGLIPASRMMLDVDLPADRIARANYIQVFWRLAHHLDPSTFPRYAWIHTGVLTTICAVGLAWVIRRSSGSDLKSNCEQPEMFGSAWQALATLLAAAMLIASVGIVVGWHSVPALKLPDWQWRASVLKFYPFRCFDALLPACTALMVCRMAGRLSLPRLPSVVLCAMLAIGTCGAAFRWQQIVPNAYSSLAYAEWKEACRWLSGNTPSDALVLGPREGFGLKWFAERAEYVCFKDCPQDAAGILEWNSRLWTLHDWAETSWKDQRFDVSDTAQLHRETKVTHILTRQLGPFESQPVYENSIWRIYRIDGN